MTSTFQPDWASPPGATISQAISVRRISHEQLAERMGRDHRFVQSLLDGEEFITAEVARLLSTAVGSTEDFWLNRERNYRAAVRRLFQAQLRTTPDSWIRSLPLDDMVRFGWLAIRPREQVLDTCRRFFSLKADSEWTGYESRYVNVAFRTSAAFETNPASVAAWLRKGELEAAAIPCQPWAREQFKRLIPKLRNLSRQRRPFLFLPRLQKLCADVGVAVVVVRAPDGCRASGAARRLSKDKMLIQLSTRYQTDDHFWFSFFHEAGHIIFHAEDDLFIDGIGEQETKKEGQANDFAASILLPVDEIAELKLAHLSYRSIIRFSLQKGIAPGIVVGQLQNKGLADKAWFNRVKRRLDWTGVAA